MRWFQVSLISESTASFWGMPLWPLEKWRKSDALEQMEMIARARAPSECPKERQAASFERMLWQSVQQWTEVMRGWEMRDSKASERARVSAKDVPGPLKKIFFF